MKNCGKDCLIKNIKGCQFADKNAPDYKADSETFFSGYDFDFVYDGCPVQEAIKNNHVWSLYTSLDLSKSFNLLEMPFLHSIIYKTIINDRNIVLEQEVQNGRK